MDPIVSYNTTHLSAYHIQNLALWSFLVLCFFLFGPLDLVYGPRSDTSDPDRTPPLSNWELPPTLSFNASCFTLVDVLNSILGLAPKLNPFL